MEATHPEIIVSEDGFSVECDSYEHRVGVGTVNLCRGEHYWEFEIDHFDGRSDIAFGIASPGVLTEKVLGKFISVLI